MSDPEQSPRIDPEEIRDDIIPLTSEPSTQADVAAPDTSEPDDLPTDPPVQPVGIGEPLEATSDNPFGLEHPEAVEDDEGGTTA